MAVSSSLRIHRRAPRGDAFPGGATVVSVGGDVDLVTSGALRDGLAPHLSDPGTALLVVDMTEVDFLACSGLSILLDANDVLTARGARLCVVAESPAVLRPITVTGLTDALRVVPSLPTALGQSDVD